MIWHFLEVWAMLAVTFVVGCLLGAYFYGVVAATRLATAQGALADSVGDVLDRVKVRLGIGPAWRPVHLQRIERPIPQAIVEPERWVDEEAYDEEVAAELPLELAAPEIAAVGTASHEISERIVDDQYRPAAILPPEANPALIRAFASTPVPRAIAAPRAYVAPKRPAGLASPRGGVPDNLQRIKGIGKRNEARLNEIGIFHFGQIAAWTPGEVRWIGEFLELSERIERDDWVGQGTVLAMGTETGFEKSAERRRQRRRQQREFQSRMDTATNVPAILPPRQAATEADLYGDGEGEVEYAADAGDPPDESAEYNEPGYVEYDDDLYEPGDREGDADDTVRDADDEPTRR